MVNKHDLDLVLVVFRDCVQANLLLNSHQNSALKLIKEPPTFERINGIFNIP